jgi:hypothetical protein
LTLNFKEALATLSRALPPLLSSAAACVSAGLLILLEFGMAIFALRLVRVTASSAMLILPVFILLGGWLTILACKRFFLYRRQAVMLFLFSGKDPSSAALEARRLFPSFPSWSYGNRRLRRALQALHRDNEQAASSAAAVSAGRLAQALLSRSILALTFSRLDADVDSALGAGMALYWRHGDKTRRLARRWLGFSLAVWVLLFFILALANGFIFLSAGVPVVIGITLAFVIAWVVHQAFVAPLALAGVSAALLAEVGEHEPDPALCEKLAPLLTP